MDWNAAKRLVFKGTVVGGFSAPKKSERYVNLFTFSQYFRKITAVQRGPVEVGSYLFGFYLFYIKNNDLLKLSHIKMTIHSSKQCQKEYTDLKVTDYKNFRIFFCFFGRFYLTFR